MTRQQEGQNLITHIVRRELLTRLRVGGREHEGEDVLLVCPNALLQLCLSLRHNLLHKFDVLLIESAPFPQKFTGGQHLWRGGGRGGDMKKKKKKKKKCERAYV